MNDKLKTTIVDICVGITIGLAIASFIAFKVGFEKEVEQLIIENKEI